LTSREIVDLPEVKRLLIWEKLDDLVRCHRKFADAEWSMPEETVNKIEAITNTLSPTSPELKYRHLFTDRELDLVEDKGNYEDQLNRLYEYRQEAIQEIFDKDGMRAVLEFAHRVAKPGEVGRALGNIETGITDRDILPALLDSKDETEKKVLNGFVIGRFGKLGWLWSDKILNNDWSNKYKSAFLVLLPFEEGTWSRVKSQLGKENESLYWQKVVVNPYGLDRDLTLGIEKLVQYGRPSAAILCLSRMLRNKNGNFNEELAIRALLAVLKTPETSDPLQKHNTVEVIKRLQQSSTVNSEALFTIEWNFLPWLGRLSSGAPVTLEKRLASDPAFFAEVISLIFRSKNEETSEVAIDERRQIIAQNAYRLLTEWRWCPGKLCDGTFDTDRFTNWLAEVKRITKKTGHLDVAQDQLGHILAYAPPDPDGLWIHSSVASALNARDAESMRSGFTIELFNQRGVHTFTAGKEERELARLNREKAQALEEKGYSRFAASMRKFAESYERQAKSESERSPFEEI
jgi:hypothetical protein